MPEGHDATIEVCNIMSFVLYTQILKQSVLKPASPGITLRVATRHTLNVWHAVTAILQTIVLPRFLWLPARSNA